MIKWAYSCNSHRISVKAIFIIDIDMCLYIQVMTNTNDMISHLKDSTAIKPKLIPWMRLNPVLLMFYDNKIVYLYVGKDLTKELIRTYNVLWTPVSSGKMAFLRIVVQATRKTVYVTKCMNHDHLPPKIKWLSLKCRLLAYVALY